MKVRFWGVRGSIPAPGPETNRYGGNTSCVSVTAAGGHRFIIDMGTGIMQLGHELMASDLGKGKGRATILLSHAHWDHIQGFGFFPPVFVPGNQFELYGHAESSSRLEGILEGQMNPHFSPIYTLRNLGANIEFKAVTPGQPFDVGGVTVSAVVNPHGKTTVLAFRLEEGGRSLVYAGDVGYPDDGPSKQAIDLYRGADLLIHDSTYTPKERATRKNRGLSSYADAANAAVAAGAKTLCMFHYDQDHADAQVDEIRDMCRAELDRLGGKEIELIAAAEGLELEI